MSRLAERVALVTGASRGIGRAVARRFAAEGAQVICLARTQAALEELDDEIRAAGGLAPVLVPQDLRDFDKIDAIAAALYQRFGRLDVLVGNAAVIGGGLGPVGDLAPKHFHEVFDVNVTANWRLIRACGPLLRMSAAGRAIFVTSGVTREVFPYWGPYAATKAALETLVRTWAAEVVNISDIRANLIDPGKVATRLRAQAFPGEDATLLAQPEAVTEAFVRLAEAAWQGSGEIVRA
ncbi:MAG: SDR family NAD(P)-dependent oxidoreductase [Magnetospirillum sp.]|nr:SDR family NAD(P)-dependent oxidoreductase [Magnetospirillum sp.]